MTIAIERFLDYLGRVEKDKQMCIVLTLTSWVDVAVLPIDFNHEITWTEHLFANYILSIIFSQLYSVNALDNDIEWVVIISPLDAGYRWVGPSHPALFSK